MEDVRMVFDRFDENKDGKISAEELASVLNSLGSDSSAENVSRMMNEIDTNHDGFISFDEFTKVFKPSEGSSEANAQSLKDAFEMYDLNKDGLISSTELQSILTRLGHYVSVQDCVNMIKSVDADHDGFVNIEEFKKLMGDQSHGSS